MHPPVPVEAQKLELPNAQLDALLSDMKQRGTILDATLYVYFSDDTGIDCKYALTAKLAGEAYRAGVRLSAGTDDEPGDSKESFSALTQELIPLVQDAGLTPSDAIQSGKGCCSAIRQLVDHGSSPHRLETTRSFASNTESAHDL
jgi:hypothetical protein